ncbi:uncharacterized protein BYT42DRAFT_622723 [Radiomyces spectabilis]|uniref:uncharacterized protein n=1 Tax=Radiomyces spectabilis TaxID=64574 RepID=UPI00221FF3E2|nr:uncharacterized protein BYT42DRAFT_622723 [Radiomyces spectabilis]KAI8371628.1 hypothetical protein BYT42DRAFT_622723 [Radiomyces spectabilis]
MSDGTYRHVLAALGAFDYTAANKLSAKLLKTYSPFSNVFLKLSNCENLYTQLSFMKSKWFVRKDAFLSSLYTYLIEDITKEITLLEASPAAHPTEHKATNIRLLNALVALCKARLALIGFFRQVELKENLLLLGTAVEREMNILQSLLKARDAIISYAFQDTCIALFLCKQELNDWKRECQAQDYPEHRQKTAVHTGEVKEATWRFPFFTAEARQKQYDAWPPTLRWHTKYLENLTAKMTLYFNSILLSKESMLSEDEPEKNLWKALKIDYYDQISTFRRRFGAYSIGLVYEVTSAAPFYPQGYVCSGTPYEPPQGIHSFPFIFCHPNQAPKDHLPNIISIVQVSRTRLNDPKSGPIYFFDNKIGSAYYLMRVDEHAVLVIIYLDRHAHREPTTAEFMTNIVTSLRGASVIADLVKRE